MVSPPNPPPILTINLSAMAYGDDVNNIVLQMNFINNTIIAFSQRIASFLIALKGLSIERISDEGINGFY